MREFLSAFDKIEFDKIRQRIGSHLHTPAAAEHVAALRPMTDPVLIRRELGLTSEMRRLLEDGTPPPLRTLPDLRVPLQRSSIVDFILPAADLLGIAHLAAAARELLAFFRGKGESQPALAAEASLLTAEKVLEYNILRAIDPEGRVLDSASRELAGIRAAIRRKNDDLRGRMESILGELRRRGAAQEDLITTRDGRLVIPVRAEFKHQVPGFIHSISSSGQTAFIEPTQTLDMHNELRTLESRERQEVERILKELTGQVREAAPRLLNNLSVTARIDFVHAKARHSLEIGGSEPQIADARRLNLRAAIHPLLLAKHRREQITPLDLEAGEGYTTLIISGPNAGGKSVAMKTVGLLSAMAQSGCHIPASPDSELFPFTELFVEMGDEQSIENDLSTFSSHLRNLKAIVEHATPTSLVLVDEIGNGTDPALGSAIGIAVLERLSAAGALTIVTSHHGAFKTAGFEHPSMENAGMGFDPGTLRPTFRLVVGRPGNSYALEIARNMDFPPDVLERAVTLAGEENVKLSDYLVQYEEKSQRLDALLAAAEKREHDARSRQTSYEEKLRHVQEEVRSIRSRTEEELRHVIEGGRKQIEAVVREIRESGASKEAVRMAKSAIEELSRQSVKERTAPSTRGETIRPRPGMIVTVRGTGMTGEVLEISHGAKAVIESGGKRVVVPFDQLDRALEKPVANIGGNDFIETDKPAMDVDLRGLYGDESIAVLEQFIDRAILHKLTRVRIIHGKGTGALRKRVSEYLSRNRQIESFQLGEWNEGGAGVTIAQLRV